jgi:hypothetical protein
LIIQGAQVCAEWIAVVKSLLDRRSLCEHRENIRSGEPRAAFECLIKILRHNIELEAQLASVNTISLAGRIALPGSELAAPGIALLTELTKALIKLRRCAMLVKMGRDAEKMVNEGVFNITLFDACPLLGCYMLREAATSDLIPFYYADHGKWRREIERWEYKVHKPILKLAQTVIDTSPIVLLPSSDSRNSTSCAETVIENSPMGLPSSPNWPLPGQIIQ